MAESKGNGLQSALRRRLLMGLAGVPAIALMPRMSFAARAIWGLDRSMPTMWTSGR